MPVYKEFHINQFLSLRLEKERGGTKRTMIYVAGKRFIQCKHLLLDILVTKIKDFREIKSIDKAAEKVDRLFGKELHESEISPEVEFWGHCSNLQAWYGYDYDTRLLHSILAFALLGKLTDVGDPLAKKMFKSELISRYESAQFLKMIE